MDRYGDSPIPTAYDEAVSLRRRRMLGLRGAYGVGYGLAAYGSPIGAVTGVQQPGMPPPPPADAPPTMGPQFPDGGGPVTDQGGSGPVDAGGSGDGGAGGAP